MQFLNIKVSSITPGVKPFVIRLNSTDYGDLREKLQAPIRNARNVVIHQSLSDKFIEAFKEHVAQNDAYHLQDGEEVCTVCRKVLKEAKLKTKVINHNHCLFSLRIIDVNYYCIDFHL